MPMALPITNAAILIPTRNRPAILANTLEELRRKGLEDLPLWVYDDASEDPKAIENAVLAVWPAAHVIFGEKRRGQAGARNALMKACGTEFGIMLEDDVYFLNVGTIEEHIRHHASHPEWAVIQFKCKSKGTGEQNLSDAIGACELPSFLAGASLFHLPTILKVGGYRDFFVYAYEEPDLAMRLWEQGCQIWYDPGIFVEHNQWYSPNERRDFREYDLFYARNSLLLATMNMPLWLGLPIGIIRSVRRAFHHKRNYRIKLKGLLEGIALTFSHWDNRTPLSARKAFGHWQFTRNGAEHFKP